MKTRVAVVVSLFLLGCPEEKMGPGEATPITPTERPKGPPPPPVAKEVKPEVKEEAPRPPPVPTTPAGLMRTKVGDSVEFSWRRLGEAQLDSVDQAKAMAMIHSKADMERMKGMAAGLKPKASYKTGTVVVTRTQPESPFTFRVELKQGKEVDEYGFAYAASIPLHEISFHTTPEDPRTKAKIAGVDLQVVEKESRRLAPDVDGLAIAGGLVSEKALEEYVGATSVELVKFGPSKATATPADLKTIESFEPPIAVAMQLIVKLGVVDPDEKVRLDKLLMEQIATLATPCVKDAKPKSGTLGGSIVGGKVEMLTWNDGKPAPAFDKCVKAALKKLKLPKEETVIDVGLPKAAE